MPKAPFNFEVLNKSLTVTQGDDLTIQLALSGNEFPQEIYLQDGVNTYKLEKETISRFNFTFKNIQKHKSLRFFGGGFSSASFAVEVKPRPSLLNMSATLVYPAYLNRKDEQLNNVGDLLIPEGTKVSWQLHTENSSKLAFMLQNQLHSLKVVDDKASFTATILKNSNYKIMPKNEFVSPTDSLAHQIAVIADLFPSIAVTETPDSVSSKALYFSGNIADDHGFSSLKFKYSIKASGKTIGEQQKSIPIKNNQIENAFFYLLDLNQLDIKPGEILTYYFEVADNDAVNGAKISRSEIKTYQAQPSNRLQKN